MNQIFVNLKRFDVPRRLGGLCPLDDPAKWIESVLDQTIGLGLGSLEDTQLAYLLPEGLASIAVRWMLGIPPSMKINLSIGCQGVHWEDIAPGKNFGAFTSFQPATAVRNLGVSWAILGHSEERKAWQQVMAAFEPGILADERLRQKAARSVDAIINSEVLCALRAGLNVLVCVGETAGERGEGSFEEQKPRIERVLSAQVSSGLKDSAAALGERNLTIGYEPIWAIGPGKVPPEKEYIAFVSTLIRQAVQKEIHLDIPVVYGGGLKEENAAMIASIPTIAGGLVALTRFSGDIGFNVEDLAGIIANYRRRP